MGITNGLVKYLGGELAEAGGKGASKVASAKLTNLLSKAVDKASAKTLSTLSKVGEQLPAVAQKADDLIMENGKPKVFYHGSPKTDIDVLDLSNAGKNTGSGEKALYFTDTYPAAEEFSYERLPSNSMFVEKRGKKGKVYERNLKNSNLVDLGNLSDDQIDELFDYANGLAKYDGKEKFVKNLKDFRSAGNDQLIKSQLDLEALAKSPYDGFVAKMYPGENDAREYAIFDPTRAVKTNNTELDVDTTKALKNTMDKYGASDGGGKIPEASSGATNDDMMTLYRGLTQKYDPNYPVAKLDTSGYESWTDNIDLAKKYGNNVYSIEVPKSDIKTSYLDEDPMSPTYGDRNPLYSIDKKAGLDGVSGNEYLLEVGSDYQEGLEYIPVELPNKTAKINNAELDVDTAKSLDDAMSKYGTTQKDQRLATAQEINPMGEAPAEIINKTKTYLEPAEELGKDLKSAASAMRVYKDKNMLNMADNMIDAYDESNFDWAAIRRKGEQALTNLLGEENLKNLKVLVEPVVNNSSRKGEHEVNKLVAANFLKSNDSDDIVKLSRELLPAGKKIYRRGDKSGISWTTNEELAKSGKYDGKLIEHTLTEKDRYIAPEIIDILQRTLENEYQVIFKLGE